MTIQNAAINIGSLGNQKNKSVHDRLRKRVVDQAWADYEEEGNEKEYVWQEGQWCPGGLTRSQKRRVQCLRNKELEQAQASGKPQYGVLSKQPIESNHRLIFKWLFYCHQNLELQQIKRFIQISMNKSMRK